MKFIPLKIKRKGFQKLKNKRKIFFVLFLFQRIYFSKFQKCDLLWYVSGTRYYIINHSVIFEYAPIIYYVEPINFRRVQKKFLILINNNLHRSSLKLGSGAGYYIINHSVFFECAPIIYYVVRIILEEECRKNLLILINFLTLITLFIFLL